MSCACSDCQTELYHLRRQVADLEAAANDLRRDLDQLIAKLEPDNKPTGREWAL